MRLSAVLCIAALAVSAARQRKVITPERSNGEVAWTYDTFLRLDTKLVAFGLGKPGSLRSVR